MFSLGHQHPQNTENKQQKGGSRCQKCKKDVLLYRINKGVEN